MPRKMVISDNSDQDRGFMPAISEPYLLSVCVPIIIDEEGVRWCNELWAKDLARHLDYLSNVMLACPRIFAQPTEFDVPLNVAPFEPTPFYRLAGSENSLGGNNSISPIGFEDVERNTQSHYCTHGVWGVANQ